MAPEELLIVPIDDKPQLIVAAQLNAAVQLGKNEPFSLRACQTELYAPALEPVIVATSILSAGSWISSSETVRHDFDFVLMQQFTTQRIMYRLVASASIFSNRFRFSSFRDVFIKDSKAS